MQNHFAFLLFVSVCCFFVHSVHGQRSTGLQIDTARAASTFGIAVEYFPPSHCLVQAHQVNTGFNTIARFDLALANVGNTSFSSSALHALDTCLGAEIFQSSLTINVFEQGTQNTLFNYIAQPKGICLEDTEQTTLPFSGTAPSSATYHCGASVNGISPGWQTVVDRNSNIMLVDLTNSVNSGSVPLGAFYTMQVVFSASQFCNCSDVTGTFDFYLPNNPECYPSPVYTYSVLPTSDWTNPASHTIISTGFQDNMDIPEANINIFQQDVTGFFDGPLSFCDGSAPTSFWIRDNGILAFDVNSFGGNTFDGGVQQNDNEINGALNYVERSYFPYWDDVHFINSSYSTVYFFSSPPDMYITWVNIDSINNGPAPVTIQAHFFANRSVIYTYQVVPSSGPYMDGDSASAGMCLGGVFPNNATTIARNVWEQQIVDVNCVVYSTDSTKLVGGGTSVFFNFTTQTSRLQDLPAPPTVVFSVPNSPEILNTYTFSAANSTIFNTDPSTKNNAYYLWSWGDGSLPSIGATVNHTFINVGTFNIGVQIFDGIQFSNVTSQSLYVSPFILTNNTKTSGDGGDGTAGYIALAVILPIAFVVLVVVLVAIFVFVFLRRHILSSGGAWWEEDPIYLNLEEQQ